MFLKPKGKVIAERRKALGYSKNKLSKIAGLGPLAVDRMEKESHLVHPLRAKAMADALGCDINEIFEHAADKNEKSSTSYQKDGEIA
jgi:transcriptional regulator with XRE-family HTH domain